jgi:hypothetical protein
MKTRMSLAASLLLAGMLLLASPAMAGGWAVITLDELSGEIVAGEPFEIGFTVRQHGVTPLDGLTPTVSARQPGSSVTEQAKAQGATGHYVATLTFPQGGEWDMVDPGLRWESTHAAIERNGSIRYRPK